MSPRNKLLEIAPLTLIFPIELDGKASCSLQLSNNTDHRVAFKVDTTSPNNYAIPFNRGILPPRSKCTIVVVMKHPDILCHDEFLVQSVIVTEDASSEETAATLCKEQPGNSVDEVTSLPVSCARKVTISDTSNLNAPKLVQEKGECSGTKTEKPSSQSKLLLRLNANIWKRTDTSTEGVEAERSACGNKCQPYNEKSHEQNEVPEKPNQLQKIWQELLDTSKKEKPKNIFSHSLAIKRERTDKFMQGCEAEQSKCRSGGQSYNGIRNGLNEVSKKSNDQDIGQEISGACKQERGESSVIKLENPSWIEGSKNSSSMEEFKKESGNATNEVIKYEKFQEKMLNESKKLKLGSMISEDTRKVDMLPAETKRRILSEKQHANMRPELQNIQKTFQEMLNEIEELKRKCIELQNEKGKIQRDCDELRLQVERQASSSNHSVNNIIEFTYSELMEGTNGLNDSLKIGEGGYGKVYRGCLHHTPVAIKILKNKNHGETDFNQEVDIISRVRHPNLVVLIGACPEARALVYEFMPNGSLEDLLENTTLSKTLTWEIRIRIAFDICLALIFLHSAVKPHGIVHGDIKPANILLDSNYVAKVSDFGNCRKMNRIETRTTPHHCTKTPRGTIPYIDPEYFNSAELTPQSDVYSFGIVLLELVAGRQEPRWPIGLQKSVEDALQNGRLEKFVDASAVKWPFEEAKKMAVLGLRCSDPSRKNRPDLVKEVLGEIKSMMHVAFPQ